MRNDLLDTCIELVFVGIATATFAFFFGKVATWLFFYGLV
jgi:hypothetical protein